MSTPTPPSPLPSSPPPSPPLPPSFAPPRLCESCSLAHPGTYGSGRFCSATCAKKVGARHKWALRAAPNSRRSGLPRRPLPDAPCECCKKMHDRSYGSGRFCSVHCARRIAATRKWEKSRSEKSRRLDAIKPAMLAPPLPPSALAGKRRRVVGRDVGAGGSFYVTGTAYAVGGEPWMNRDPGVVYGNGNGGVFYGAPAVPAYSVGYPVVNTGYGVVGGVGYGAVPFSGGGFEMETVRVNNSCPEEQPKEEEKSGEGSETAARALLCLRSTETGM